MNWINIHTDVLRSEAYIGAEPVQRATWLSLLAWSCTQENGGVIADCRHWKDRRWQQLCGVTLDEIDDECDLWYWTGNDLVVSYYPDAKEREVKAKREAGRLGGSVKSDAKTLAAKENGSNGGRPETQAETQALLEAETQAKPKQNPSKNPTEREGKGRERKEYHLPIGKCVGKNPDEQGSSLIFVDMTDADGEHDAANDARSTVEIASDALHPTPHLPCPSETTPAHSQESIQLIEDTERKAAESAALVVVRAYNEICCPPLPRCTARTAGREAAARRLFSFLGRDPERVRAFFRHVTESDFLMGRGKSPWRGCNLVWLTKQENAAKVIDGNYHR